MTITWHLCASARPRVIATRHPFHTPSSKSSASSSHPTWRVMHAKSTQSPSFLQQRFPSSTINNQNTWQLVLLLVSPSSFASYLQDCLIRNLITMVIKVVTNSLRFQCSMTSPKTQRFSTFHTRQDSKESIEAPVYSNRLASNQYSNQAHSKSEVWTLKHWKSKLGSM